MMCRKGMSEVYVRVACRQGMSEGFVGRLRTGMSEGYVGRACRKRRQRIDFTGNIRVTLGPRAEICVKGMSDVCRKYVGQGDSG